MGWRKNIFQPEKKSLKEVQPVLRDAQDGLGAARSTGCTEKEMKRGVNFFEWTLNVAGPASLNKSLKLHGDGRPKSAIAVNVKGPVNLNSDR